MTIVIAALALIACGSAAERRTWRGPTGQTCSAVIHGEPSVVGLEALLRDGVRTREIPNWSGPDTLLILAAYDSTGAFSGVKVFGRPGEVFDAHQVAAALHERFRPAASPNSGAAALFVREAKPDLRPHRFSEECEPRLANRAEIARLLEEIARRDRARDRSVVAWLFSDGNGMVAEALIDRSSGDIEIDRAMLQVARRARFLPATRDGFAQPVWIAIPLTINRAPPQLPSAPCPPQAAGSLACRL